MSSGVLTLSLGLTFGLSTMGCSNASSDDGSEADTSSASGESASTEGEGETEAESEGETGETGEPPAPVEMELFEDVTFYDGYAAVVDEPVPEGAIRHRNDLVATRLSEAQLDSIQNTLHVEVFVGALCDNYDRLGHVFVSFVPAGAETYDPGDSETVTRFEVARFVTPFMNMNKAPTIVPFNYDLDALVPLLKDPQLREGKDVWVELSVFGVPYAANTEIPGCDGRNDTSRAALYFRSDSTVEALDYDLTVPLAVNESFNNHQDGASDAIGTTTKTVPFDLEADTETTQLVLITSNHGANSGGEEYNRRDHYVSVDGEEVYTYKPGRTSCEPFRMYNTQGNGIYGSVPKTDAEWQAFSNWCPGDVIDVRTVELGAMSAGAHEFVIDVPDAVFNGGEGNFPFSLYVQGKRAG